VCDAYDELIAEALVDRYVFTLSGFRIPAVVIDANGLPHETTKRITCALRGVFPQKFAA